MECNINSCTDIDQTQPDAQQAYWTLIGLANLNEYYRQLYQAVEAISTESKLFTPKPVRCCVLTGNYSGQLGASFRASVSRPEFAISVIPGDADKIGGSFSEANTIQSQRLLLEVLSAVFVVVGLILLTFAPELVTLTPIVAETVNTAATYMGDGIRAGTQMMASIVKSSAGEEAAADVTGEEAAQVPADVAAGPNSLDTWQSAPQFPHNGVQVVSGPETHSEPPAPGEANPNDVGGEVTVTNPNGETIPEDPAGEANAAADDGAHMPSGSITEVDIPGTNAPAQAQPNAAQGGQLQPAQTRFQQQEDEIVQEANQNPRNPAKKGRKPLSSSTRRILNIVSKAGGILPAVAGMVAIGLNKPA